MHVTPLVWGSAADLEDDDLRDCRRSPPDLLVVCDCIYNGKFHQALAETIDALCGPATVVHFVWEVRNEDAEEAFLEGLAERGFARRPLVEGEVSRQQTSNTAVRMLSLFRERP